MLMKTEDRCSNMRIEDKRRLRCPAKVCRGQMLILMQVLTAICPHLIEVVVLGEEKPCSLGRPFQLPIGSATNTSSLPTAAPALLPDPTSEN